MSTDLLFEHFATLATAPEGIARLRELILQLAVQGKLGTQDAGDEPASVLLERIRSRISSGDKKNPTQNANLEEVPFPLPKGWEWTQIGNIALIKGGKRLPNGSSFSDVPTNHIYIRISNMKNGTIEERELKYIEKSVFEQINHYTIDKDDIYITIAGTIGDVGEVPERFHGMSLTENAAKIIFKEIDKKYLILAIKSKSTQSQFFDKTNTQAQPKLALKRISETVIPLPPLAEQHRIVAKVDRLMALCDELEARQQQERTGCLRLGTASLAGLQNAESPEEFERQWAQVCDAFDLILDCTENVAVLRQTILQLAVQGRLVRQEPGDEPAGKLVEKIKKTPSEQIRDEEKQYHIPDSWIWIRLGAAIESMANGIYKPGAFYSDDGIACLRMYNINSGKINFTKLKRMVLNDQEVRQYLLKHGDLLVNRVNSRELVGKAAVIPELTEPVIFESKNIRVRINTEILLPDFVNILFQTKEVWQVWQGNAKQTCGQASVSQPQIAGICTPLPPLAEQHRIVAKVDALMKLCDALESRLKERAEVQERFAAAVGKQVVG